MSDDPPKLTLVTDAGEHVAPPRNVVRLPVITSLNLDPDQLLQEAIGKLDCVVIVGYEKGEDGGEFFASSVADAATATWLLLRGQYKLMQIVDEFEDTDDEPPAPSA